MFSRQVQIAIIGASSVGKTAIVTQLISAIFEEEHNPTADDSHVAMLDFDETVIKLTLHDTSGSEKFADAREEKYSVGEGFLAVYSISSRQSFDQLKTCIDKLQDMRGTKVIPIVLVGNKVDLQKSRQVQTSEGEEMAKALGCPFMEITAKERDYVIDVFTQLLRETDRIAELRKESVKTKPKRCSHCAVV